MVGGSAVYCVWVFGCLVLQVVVEVISLASQDAISWFTIDRGMDAGVIDRHLRLRSSLQSAVVLVYRIIEIPLCLDLDLL